MKIRPAEVILHQPPTLTTLSPGCTWLTALFALGAIVGSGALFIAQRAQLRVQQGELAIAQEERREQEEDRRKDQGRLVSAWPYRVNSGDSFVRVEYRNGSDEPVFGCNVYVLSDWGPDPIRVRHWLGIVPPGAHHMVHFEADLPEGLLSDPPVEMVFTDARGRHWRRRGDGVLDELPENLDSGVR